MYVCMYHSVSAQGNSVKDLTKWTTGYFSCMLVGYHNVPPKNKNKQTNKTSLFTLPYLNIAWMFKKH